MAVSLMGGIAMVTAVTGASLNLSTGHPKKQDTSSATTTGTSAGTGTSGSTGTSDTSATAATTSGTSDAAGTYTATGATTGASEVQGATTASGTASADPGVTSSAANPSDGAADNSAAAHASTASAAFRAADAADLRQKPHLGAVPETAENRVPNLPMTPRLREMIAQMKSPLPIPIGLHRFTTDHPDLDALTFSHSLPQAPQVKRDMIAAPATTLMAQANLDRQSVLALLDDHGGMAALN